MVVNNPNNWHWVDKNCITWSKDYFNTKLVGLTGGSSRISKVSSVEGDVEVCQRKGKVISLFDLKLVVEFVSGDQKGTITVPELAYDSDKSSLQFDVTMPDETARADVKSNLLPKLRDTLLCFGKDLIETHSSDIQLASDEVNSVYTKANQESSVNAAKSAAESATNKSEKSATDKSEKATDKSAATDNSAKSATVSPSFSPNTSTLHLEPSFNTTAEQLYITLLDPARVAAWSRSPPRIEPKEGTEYALFGGSVSGQLVRLVENEHITMKWRLSDWKDGHHATLDIKLVQGAGETTMVVNFSGVPVGEEERVRNNFEEYYVRSIKIVFGFGAVL